MGDSNTAEISMNIHWTETLEEYFSSTGEKAHCLSWVHKKSEELYSVRKTFIDLPVIVGSGVIAFLNAGSSSMFDDPKISSVALGIGSLVVGILNTMGTYFGWAKRAEGHRISAIHYAKLYRFIAVEMSLPRDERMSPHDLLKLVKDQYDRLAEISPLVPTSVIHKFKRKFKDTKDITKPEEANGLHKIEVYRQRPNDENVTPRTIKLQNLNSPKNFVDAESKDDVQFTNPMHAMNVLKNNNLGNTIAANVGNAAGLQKMMANVINGNGNNNGPSKMKEPEYVPTIAALESIETSIKLPELLNAASENTKINILEKTEEKND